MTRGHFSCIIDRMRQENKTLDGFITRRPDRSSLNESHRRRDTRTTVGHMRKEQQESAQMHSGRREKIAPAQTDSGLTQNISDSLIAIDADVEKHKEKRQRRHRRRRYAKVITWSLGIIAAVVIGFLLYKAWQLGSRVFQGNMLGIFQQQELKMDQHGRSNVLILGSTDDMADRDGASLTDSMMVISVDQKKKDAYIFSIPRDLWVQYGQACVSGYEGKINAFYACADDGDGKEAETRRMNETKELVGKIFDMDIQYVAHINTVVIRDSVAAVGGVTVNVDSRHPDGVLDATFDDLCRDSSNSCPRGHFLDFKNGPNDMNGLQAMAFSQARGHTAPTYGLEQSNFDREKNQQLVLMALKDKAMSTGTLTDFGKITALMDAMGDNLRTNVDMAEIRTIVKITSEMEDKDIHRLSFVEQDNRLLTTGAVGSQSVVQPVAGLRDYSEIRAYLKKTIFATQITRENARIWVANGGGPVGVAGKESDKLALLGMNVLEPGNIESSGEFSYQIYQLSAEDKHSATRKKLEQVYGVKTTKGVPPFSTASGVDFVVVVGSRAESS